VEMLSESVQTLHELAGLCESPFAVFFEPHSLDDRIVNQFAFNDPKNELLSLARAVILNHSHVNLGSCRGQSPFAQSAYEQHTLRKSKVNMEESCT